MKPRHVPLARALSKLGLASRTQAADWIRAGRVSVRGRVVKDPGHPVIPESGAIQVDGARVTRQARLIILLHKPKGVVTTRSDEKGRPTVYSLLKGIEQHLIPVGRLDFATTGLLLLTNDTRFSAWLTDPENEVPRTYLVTVRGEIEDETLARLEKGVTDQGEHLSADAVTLRKRSGRETHLTVRLVEGKNREIRRLFASAGHEVTRLKRVAFGNLELGDLPLGAYRELSPRELKKAFPSLKLGSKS